MFQPYAVMWEIYMAKVLVQGGSMVKTVEGVFGLLQLARWYSGKIYEWAVPCLTLFGLPNRLQLSFRYRKDAVFFESLRQKHGTDEIQAWVEYTKYKSSLKEPRYVIECDKYDLIEGSWQVWLNWGIVSWKMDGEGIWKMTRGTSQVLFQRTHI